MYFQLVIWVVLPLSNKKHDPHKIKREERLLNDDYLSETTIEFL